MKRYPFLIVALGGALCGSAAIAQAPEQPIPLQNVVLFSSGVGYFQREGRVNGNAEIDLSFRADQINDILKSLVLFDPQGTVRPVTYTTKDAVLRRLQSVGQSIDRSISLGALLRQFQGARVRLETGSEGIEGRILSVSLKAVPVDKGGVVQQEVINILTEGGLRAVPLDQVTQVKLLDERLDRELREALELLATGLDDNRRQVELRFTGNGERVVKAGYLQEMPVWKTSYRLVLDEKAKEKPYLQGWAIVENTTDEDWRNVQLSLVSGRPVSFIQDLYQPLYVPRPVVQAQVIGSPTPQTYGEVLEYADALRERADKAEADRFGGVAGARGLPPAAAPGPAGPPGLPRISGGADVRFRDAETRRKNIAASADELAKSVVSQAAGAERGELFEYAIQQPVTLPKGQAAMVPIVSENIGGELLSIYDPTSDATHALNGFRLKNTTGLHLSGGPITVFRDGIYAGDAQISNLQPQEDRLISYAVDLDLVADRKAPRFHQETLSVSAKSGVLVITRKQQRENTYSFRNQSETPKTVLVLQDIEPEFKLAVPEKPAEKTPEEYRFKLQVPAKKTAELKVVTERPLTETIALLNADLNVLISYAQNAQVSEKLRAALKQLVAMRRKITDLQAQRSALENEIKTIDQEQSRIRQNMERLDRNSPLYQQYVKKLTEQEARIEKLRMEIARLREEENAAQKELREFVDTLTVE